METGKIFKEVILPKLILVMENIFMTDIMTTRLLPRMSRWGVVKFPNSSLTCMIKRITFAITET